MTVQNQVGRAESLNSRKQEEDLEEAPSKQSREYSRRLREYSHTE